MENPKFEITTDFIIYELVRLPEQIQVEVFHYMEFLKNRFVEEKPLELRPYGLAKGKIWMSPDFDAPLEDFKEYME